MMIKSFLCLLFRLFSFLSERIKLIQEGSGLVNLDEIQKQIAINQKATNEMVLSLNQSMEEQGRMSCKV